MGSNPTLSAFLSFVSLYSGVFAINVDDFVKSPTSVLRCILRHCDVPVSMPHSSGFVRLEFEAFYFVARFPTFYGTINVE